MKIQEVQERTPELLEELLIIWEDSVRTTHLFLSDEEVRKIREYVPEALRGVEHLIFAKNDVEQPIAFMEPKKDGWKCCFSPRQKGARPWKAADTVRNQKLWNPGSYGQRAEPAGGRLL